MTPQLGLFDSIMMMIGIVIGSGIYLTTGLMAASLPSPGLILLAWAAGGLLTLAGALTFAELGAAMPQAGGQYVYLREAYGHLAGFLFGWILFLVSMGGSIAATAIAFAVYLGYFFPSLSTEAILFERPFPLFGEGATYALSAGQLVAVALILVLSVVNYVGVVFGKIVQNVFTVVKIATIVVFVVVGLSVRTDAPLDLSLNPRGLGFGELAFGFGLALVAVSWAFDGWNNINYVAGEIKNPKRNLPISLILGTVGITGAYLLVNLVYFRALSIDEMAGETRVAEQAAGALFGGSSSGLISAAVMISVFGAVNGAIFVGPRVYYAMARDGLFFERAGRLHPRFGTPANAIVWQAVWACVLTVSGSFEQLITYVVFITLIFWIAAVASVFRLRRTMPDLPRPYKTWGYPVVPAFFILAATGIVLNTVWTKPRESLVGLGLTLLGVPVYYYWRRGKLRAQQR